MVNDMDIIMDEEEFRIRLNKKSDAHIFGLQVKHITLDEILDTIGYSNYKRVRDFVNITIDSFDKDLSLDIEDYMFAIKENLMIQYPDVGYDLSFDLYDMSMHIPFMKDMFVNFIKMFTVCTDVYVEHMQFSDEMVILYEANSMRDKMSLTRSQFLEFIDMFSILNYTVRVDRTVIADSDKVKEFDKKASELKKKFGIKDKNSVTLESITSALIDSSNPNYTHETIGNKTIYQIMNSFYRMCKIKDHEFMNLVRVNATKISDNDITKNTWCYNLYQ